MVNRFILNEVSYFGPGARKELPGVVAHTARTAADRTDSTTRESYRPDGKDAG